MAALNKILIIGNMVADPELKQTQSGLSVTSFRVAVSRKYTKQGETPKTDFFEVVCWRQQAEFVTKYFKKGSSIFVCGAMQCRTWTDTDGIHRYQWEISADEISFVGSKASRSDSTSMEQASVQTNSDFVEISNDGELPF